MSRPFDESMTAAVSALIQLGRRAAQPSACSIGEVLRAGNGTLQVSCGELVLEPEDLYLAQGLDYRWSVDDGSALKLRRGDRVVLLSLDGQDYYLICKAVRA